MDNYRLDSKIGDDAAHFASGLLSTIEALKDQYAMDSEEALTVIKLTFSKTIIDPIIDVSVIMGPEWMADLLRGYAEEIEMSDIIGEAHAAFKLFNGIEEVV